MPNRTLPLFDRFPELARLPRAELGSFPTPLQSVEPVAPGLWVKRDDLSAAPMGGNKVRALEFLLGGAVGRGRVVTVGGVGSTHALSTAVFVQQSGGTVELGLWRHDMNPTAEEVSRATAALVPDRRVFGSPVPALLWARYRRWRGAAWVPPGGTSVLGMLGHVNAGLELADQVARGEMPRPARVVVPLGTGGTAAGIALGFQLAGLDVDIVAVRVVPRILGRRGRVVRLARAAATLMFRSSGRRPPDVTLPRLRVVHSAYGGAYGRQLGAAAAPMEAMARAGVIADPTYSGKALAAAVALADGAPTLLAHVRRASSAARPMRVLLTSPTRAPTRTPTS